MAGLMLFALGSLLLGSFADPLAGRPRAALDGVHRDDAGQFAPFDGRALDVVQIVLMGVVVALRGGWRQRGPGGR